MKEWNTSTWAVGSMTLRGKWTDGIKHSMKETNHEREARCGSGRSEIASNWEGQVPADDPIQRLKSGSGWGTRDPLIRRSKSKRFTVPGIGYRIVANKNTLHHPANLG